MWYVCQFFRLTVMLGAVVVIIGCTYDATVQRLAPAQQAAFRAYRKVMTSSQARTYLAKATEAERMAYLTEIGIAQRFQALAPVDREAVLAGQPRKGMSAEALRFLWGEPYEIEGHINHYERWFYLGWSISLAETGNDYTMHGAMTEVYLVNAQVVWWQDVIPDDDEGDDDDDDKGRSRS